MYETREGPNATKSQQNHDNRTANSMYQMIDGQTHQTDTNNDHTITTNGNLLPPSDEVKHRTEVVTRRIQELWSVMQEMTANDVFVPGAERIRHAVSELTAIFPTVRNVSLREKQFFSFQEIGIFFCFMNCFVSNIFFIITAF